MRDKCDILHHHHQKQRHQPDHQVQQRHQCGSSKDDAEDAGDGRRRPQDEGCFAGLRFRRPLQPPPSMPLMFHKLDQLVTSCNTRAMRYYRIWIYTCNAVLLVSVLGFCAVAGRTILADYRRHLIPSLALYQPSFLYAYLAIFTQSGVIQLVGCLGALRLSERLLNVYWLMLLVLLFGDIVIGIFWMFRLDKMLQELRPGLKFRLYSEYSHGGDFTTLWDRLQSETGCCGVQGASDFNTTRISQALLWTSPIHNNTKLLVPPSCCTAIATVSEVPLTTADINGTTPGLLPKCQAVHPAGCEDRLRVYLRQTSETLFLIGYCVIAFVKVCFIGILRYEIREMIQKIKILKSELDSRPSVASVDLESSPTNMGGHQSGGGGDILSPSHTVLMGGYHGGGGGGGAGSEGGRGTQNINGSVRGAGLLDAGTESERESLLVADPDTPAHRHHAPMAPAAARRRSASIGAGGMGDDLEYHQHRSSLHKKLFPGDSHGGDSESHCALLGGGGVGDDIIGVGGGGGAGGIPPPNGNNNYEMREFRLLQDYQPLQHSQSTPPCGGHESTSGSFSASKDAGSSRYCPRVSSNPDTSQRNM